MFACLIIRTFQLVFSVGTVFFSHNKLAGIAFRLIFSGKRTGLIILLPFLGLLLTIFVLVLYHILPVFITAKGKADTSDERNNQL